MEEELEVNTIWAFFIGLLAGALIIANIWLWSL